MSCLWRLYQLFVNFRDQVSTQSNDSPPIQEPRHTLQDGLSIWGVWQTMVIVWFAQRLQDSYTTYLLIVLLQVKVGLIVKCTVCAHFSFSPIYLLLVALSGIHAGGDERVGRQYCLSHLGLPIL